MVLKFSHFLFEKETGCPIETHDLVKNLENRQTAIEKFGYGPANPDDKVADNDMFWQAKAKMWKCSVENVKTMKCGNCAAFNISDKTRQCIADGIDQHEEDSRGVINLADLGYCEILHFKCAGDRTCDAWLVGGPLDNKDLK